MIVRRVSMLLAIALLGFGFLIALHRHARAGMPIETKLMDRHMEITLRRLPEPGDQERAVVIAAAAKRLVDKYADVADAERDGYAKFLPHVQLPQEHFTNSAYAREAWFGTFDPNHPTSIIYDRTASGLHVAGVMYTASNLVTEADLDRRVPLSIGTWHRHVNFCTAPAGMSWQTAYFGEHPRFGFNGSIFTRDECDAAKGAFVPIVFGWMIHVWPHAATPEGIWSIHGDDEHHDMVGEHEHHHGAGMYGTAPNDPLPIPLDHLPTAEVASGDAGHGASVFSQNCASCHGAGGSNGPDAPALVARGLAPGQVAFMVRNPDTIDVTSEMPKLPISDGDLADVAAYVSQLK